MPVGKVSDQVDVGVVASSSQRCRRFELTNQNKRADHRPDRDAQSAPEPLASIGSRSPTWNIVLVLQTKVLYLNSFLVISLPFHSHRSLRMAPKQGTRPSNIVNSNVNKLPRLPKSRSTYVVDWISRLKDI